MSESSASVRLADMSTVEKIPHAEMLAAAPRSRLVMAFDLEGGFGTGQDAGLA